MLTAIKKIKGLGVFGDYAPAAGLKDFSRYNLIYGENGAGKTTLSRLFAALNDGVYAEYPALQFTVATEGGSISEGQKCPRKIRVFNSDYVEANIGRFDGPLRPILIVGVENKALAEEVGREQIAYNQRLERIEQLKSVRQKLETERGKVFSAVAKTIGEATSGASLRSYRKPDAEKDFVRLAPLTAYPDEELKVYRATLRQEQAEPVPMFGLPPVNAMGDSEAVSFAQACENFGQMVAKLTLRTAQEGALKRLVEIPAISNWVEEGLRLHREHASQTCEFCAQPLPADRMAALADHFSAADQKLKADIEDAVSHGQSLTKSLTQLQLPHKQSLYSELWKEFDKGATSFEAARNHCIGALGELCQVLSEKLINRSSSIVTTASIDTRQLIAAVERISDIIQRHNDKTARFASEKAVARAALERHYLAEIAEQVAEFDRQIASATADAAKLTDGAADLPDPRGLDDLAASIKEKRAKVASAHAGGAAMTKRLRDFLGRTDLEFESNDEGYRVLRRGKAAKRLSEGEKTAIAFLYFVVQLGDQEFDVNEGIVVIDDPVSSLDSTAIYQAFACLKNAVKDAKQVFLFTHNFEFLKLLLDWLKKARKAARYYMIVCTESATERVANLEDLDQMLIDHPTEYHFLFKTLYTFKSDGKIASCYHIPNVARKLLETFLEFHAPSTASMYEQLESVEFDENKKTAIYKFTNDNSHRTGKGFDPAIVAESQKNVRYLLEMIQAVAPAHYEGLERLST